MCPCNPGQHGTGWAWTRVRCLGRAHADMAQPVPGLAGFVQMSANTDSSIIIALSCAMLSHLAVEQCVQLEERALCSRGSAQIAI